MGANHFTLAALFLAVAAVASGGDAALAAPLPLPPSSGPLSPDDTPMGFDSGPLGTVYVTGALSGIAFVQNDAALREPDSFAGISNAQMFLQNDGRHVQFFVQAGVYALPSLGTPYVRAVNATRDTFGIVPVAFLKLVPDDAWSVQLGKLPSLIGDESTVTFQNFDIARGLLWNQTSSVSRGIQVNYTRGPMVASLSWNDGYYSGRFNWVTGLLSYSLNAKETLTFSGGRNLGRTDRSSFATPLAQSNSAIIDLAYSITDGAWTIGPYIQASHVPADPELGLQKSASTSGIALLASDKLGDHWAIAGRGEYLVSQGALNLLYGPGSAAWSVTLTPTYQSGVFFARMDASYVGLEHATAGSALGRTLDDVSQIWLMAETGVLF